MQYSFSNGSKLCRIDAAVTLIREITQQSNETQNTVMILDQNKHEILDISYKIKM